MDIYLEVLRLVLWQDSGQNMALPRFPLKGFLKGDTGMDMEVDVVMTMGLDVLEAQKFL